MPGTGGLESSSGASDTRQGEKQEFSKCGPCTSSANAPWALVRNAGSQAPRQTRESGTVGEGPSKLCFNSLLGASGSLLSLGPKEGKVSSMRWRGREASRREAVGAAPQVQGIHPGTSALLGALTDPAGGATCHLWTPTALGALLEGSGHTHSLSVYVLVFFPGPRAPDD